MLSWCHSFHFQGTVCTHFSQPCSHLMAWWRRIQFHWALRHLMGPELGSHIWAPMVQLILFIMRHLRPLMCNQSQVLQDESQCVVIGFWWQVHLDKVFHTVETQLESLLFIIACLPWLTRQTHDVWCQVPHPSPTTTVKTQWFWRRKHSSPSMVWKTPLRLFAQWQLYSPGVQIHWTSFFPHLCAFYLLSSSPWQQSCHASLHAPSPLSSQRFRALSYAAGPSYQITVNLDRCTSRSTSACLRCLVYAYFWQWLSLIPPATARRCCHVCHPRVHVFQPTLSKFRHLLPECLIHQCSPRTSFVSHSHVYSDDTFLFSGKPMLQSCYICASHPRRSSG